MGDDGSRHAGQLSIDELRAEVEGGRVDTVLLAMTDMQGRLQASAWPRPTSWTTCWSITPRAATTCWRSTWT
jgi:hypothetical protein